jgi:dihydrofolate reductase
MQREGAVMGKLIMWNLMTLDGMFEGPQPWDLDFHEYAWGDELRGFSLEQAREAEGLLFGRRTYEGMAAYWSSATGETADFMNAVPKYVFSRTLERADWANSTLVKEDAGKAVARLKEQPGKDLFVFGSADLSVTFIRQGLFDEYRIGLVPITLGAGSPLFKPDSEPVRLQMLESRPLGARCLLLRYEPAAVVAAAP